MLLTLYHIPTCTTYPIVRNITTQSGNAEMTMRGVFLRQGHQAFFTILTPETVRRLVENAMPIKVMGLPEGRKRSV